MLLRLMTMFESFCYVLFEGYFYTVFLVAALELISSKLPSNLLIHVIYQSEITKNADAMSMKKAKVTFMASTLFYRM